MNKEIHEIIKKRKLHPISYQKIKNVYIVNDNKTQYVIKLNTNNYDIYKYLLSRDFPYFPKNFNNIDDDYDISLYIEGLNVSKEQRIDDYIKIISLLHNKTSYHREIDLDEIKEKYEELNNRIIYLRKYYHELNDVIDKMIFLSPSAYLLVRNISLIYSILDKNQLLLNDVYDVIKNVKSIRVSLLHNNIDLDHLIINENDYLISWDKSCFNSPIYELEEFYRKYYQSIDLDYLIKLYEKRNSLSTIEKKILLIYLSMPMEIKLTDNTFTDTNIINNEINYLNKVYSTLTTLSIKKT